MEWQILCNKSDCIDRGEKKDSLALIHLSLFFLSFFFFIFQKRPQLQYKLNKEVKGWFRSWVINIIQKATVKANR